VAKATGAAERSVGTLLTGAVSACTTATHPTGSAHYSKHLEDVKKARADPEKRQFEKAFLTWFQGPSDIKCSTCEEDVKRRNKNKPKDGIATDSKEDEEWNDSCLHPDEVPEQSDDEE